MEQGGLQEEEVHHHWHAGVGHTRNLLCKKKMETHMSLSWSKRRNDDFTFPLKPVAVISPKQRRFCETNDPEWRSRTHSAAMERKWGLWSDGGNAVINRSVGVWRLVAPLPRVRNKPGQLSFLCSNTRETDHSSGCSFYGLAHSSSEKTKLNISCRTASQTSSKALPLSAGGLGVGPFSVLLQEFSQCCLQRWLPH